MRKKDYRGAKVSKRMISKCEGVCRTYDAIQYVYADLLSNADEVQSFRVNVLLEGLKEGDYTSDFVIVKADGGHMIRECVSRKHLTRDNNETELTSEEILSDHIYKYTRATGKITM